MSLYVADVGIIKVRKELAEQFGFFFNGEYEKVTDTVIKKIVDRFHNEEFEDCIYEMRNWKHNNEKTEWINKYKTSFDGELLIFGVTYNMHNGLKRWYIGEILEIIIPYIAEQKIEQDGWVET